MVVGSGGMPPREKKLKFHVKNGALGCNYGVQLQKRLFVPKSMRYYVSLVSRDTAITTGVFHNVSLRLSYR